MGIEQGDAYRSKLRHTKERFTTVEGLLDLSVGGLIYGFLLVHFMQPLFDTLVGFLPKEPSLVWLLVAYALLGAITAVVGLAITFVIVMVYRRLIRGVRG